MFLSVLSSLLISSTRGVVINERLGFFSKHVKFPVRYFLFERYSPEFVVLLSVLLSLLVSSMRGVVINGCVGNYSKLVNFPVRYFFV